MHDVCQWSDELSFDQNNNFSQFLSGLLQLEPSRDDFIRRKVKQIFSKYFHSYAQVYHYSECVIPLIEQHVLLLWGEESSVICSIFCNIFTRVCMPLTLEAEFLIVVKYQVLNPEALNLNLKY